MADASRSSPHHKKKSASILGFFGKSDAKGTSTKEVSSLAKTCTHNRPMVAIEEHTNTGNPSFSIIGTAEKPTPVEGTPIAFRNGKIVFHEKKLNLERHPSVVAAVFGFHQHIAQLQRESGAGLPLQNISREHWSLVAMLIQERDVTISALVRAIESQLCPVVFGEDSTSNADILAAGAVEGAIMQIAENRNYGVPLGELHCSSIDEVPQGLSINRWEVKDMDLLPQDVREVVRKRRGRREQTHLGCIQWFRSLETPKRDQILSGALKKLKGGSQSSIARGSSSASANTGTSTSSPGHIGDGSGVIDGTSAFTSPKKPQTATRGQRSLQTFFATEKPPSSVSQPNKKKDYYRSTFLPFNVRDCAQVYQFRPSGSFDPDEIDRALMSALSDDGTHSGRLQTTELLSMFVSLSQPARTRAKTKAKVSVCDGMDLDEVELCLMRLRMMPIKLIQFHANRRPAYFGTCSKSVQHVSGRRPFVQDTKLLDYGIDSDAEWEAEDEDGEELRSEDEEDEEDEDDEDFDEESGFVVGEGDALTRLDGLTDDSDVDKSDYNSEDEGMEEINPDEEVLCVSDMEVDGAPTVAVRQTGNRLSGPKKSTRKSEHAPQLQRRRKVVPLTPVVVGLAFEKADLEQDSTMNICNSDSESQSHFAEESAKTTSPLDSLAVIAIDTSLPLCISTDPDDMWEDKKGGGVGGEVCCGTDGSGMGARRGKLITEQDLGALVSVVHESPLGVSRLVEELKQAIPDATKAQIERLIHEHAKKEKRPATTRLLWYVNAELVSKAHGLGISDSVPPSTEPSSSEFFESAAKRQRVSDNLKRSDGDV
ncbi:hypothetical protein COEREDRAFT_91882 [Coemansia reversa NRRL 1564]|uniref:Uncharacterized protein n=1 Tax=Coemansia reversa (strain ATCC 12441 / NRRL 1564) TaxID=763665 RepID=A0A2G5BEU1_COERN|nr:hypothetical protein COEREDRAFT_91882 [Coemansia reversa NRRL 1564]|eukprot:PIA17529.1 hypothetical protein COEREDRAFT_91882 [Coemansia reversa NRRL 1564]